MDVDTNMINSIKNPDLKKAIEKAIKTKCPQTLKYSKEIKNELIEICDCYDNKNFFFGSTDGKFWDIILI
jgi:hypothetical protein